MNIFSTKINCYLFVFHTNNTLFSVVILVQMLLQVLTSTNEYLLPKLDMKCSSGNNRTNFYLIFPFKIRPTTFICFLRWRLSELDCVSHKNAGPGKQPRGSRKNSKCYTCRSVISWIVLWFEITSLVCTALFLYWLHSAANVLKGLESLPISSK